MKVVEFQKPDGSADAADKLEKLAARAKDGEFVTAVYVLFRSDGTWLSGQAGATLDILKTVGVFECLKHDFFANADKTIVEES